jgi:hypothetical protein
MFSRLCKFPIVLSSIPLSHGYDTNVNECQASCAIVLWSALRVHVMTNPLCILRWVSRDMQANNSLDAVGIENVAKDLPGRWYPVGQPWLGDLGTGARSADSQVIPGCTHSALVVRSLISMEITQCDGDASDRKGADLGAFQQGILGLGQLDRPTQFKETWS